MDILIDKEIGGDFWSEGITPSYMREQLAKVPDGEDVRLVLDSPGGSVWDCVAIYNVIRDFARANPNVKITTYIQGMAASSASVIALAARDVSRQNKVVVEDNSVYMIHNAWAICIGNENDMRDTSEYLAQIDGMIRDCYVRCSGNDLKTVTKWMDAETFMFGSEIMERGFADEVISSGRDDWTAEKTDDEILAYANCRKLEAQAKVRDTQQVMRQKSGVDAVTKIAACAKNLPQAKSGVNAATQNSKTGAMPPENKLPIEAELEGCMTAEELKKNHPDVYAQVMEDGRAAGVKEERSRCDALLSMGEVAGCMDVAAGFIRDGSAVADNKVQTTLFEKRVAKAALDARNADNPPHVNPPTVDMAEDYQKKMEAAFDEGLRG